MSIWIRRKNQKCGCCLKQRSYGENCVTLLKRKQHESRILVKGIQGHCTGLNFGSQHGRGRRHIRIGQYKMERNDKRGQARFNFITHQVPKGLLVDEVVNMGQHAMHMSLVKE